MSAEVERRSTQEGLWMHLYAYAWDQPYHREMPPQEVMESQEEQSSMVVVYMGGSQPVRQERRCL